MSKICRSHPPSQPLLSPGLCICAWCRSQNLPFLLTPVLLPAPAGQPILAHGFFTPKGRWGPTELCREPSAAEIQRVRAPASAAGASRLPLLQSPACSRHARGRAEVPWVIRTSALAAAPWLVSKSPSANESSCHGAQEMGLKPDSKAPATRSSRGGESFLSSPARSLTGLSSLPRQGFEGLQGPPTCAAGAGSGVSFGTGREERVESSMGEKCSSLREMPSWRRSYKPSSSRMVMRSKGHQGLGMSMA